MAISTRVAWDGGLGISTDSAGGSFDPEVAPPPTAVLEGERVVKATTVDSFTVNGTEVAVVQREAEAPYQRHRIVVGGVDVTYLRGVQTPMPSYSLVSPFRYGPGQITFPQIHAAFERPGHGELTWLSKFATVKVQRVDAEGVVTATDYIGFLSDRSHENRELTFALGGQAEGRAVMVDRQMPIFPGIQDIGDLVAGSLQHGIRLPVGNDVTTGIRLADTGGVSQLDFIAEVLAKSTQKDGTQWTVMPNANGKYRLLQKDITTIGFTAYIDGMRVQESLHRDYTEEPNRVWASGIAPDGGRIRFAIAPGSSRGRDPFPGTLSPGDSGDDVTELLWRLFTIGKISDPSGLEWTTDTDDPVTKAINRVQRDARVTASPGVVNEATWNALFDPDVTGYSMRRMAVRPAAQKSYTKALLTNASGQVIGNNPDYDRTRPLVDVTVDMGAGFDQGQIEDWAEFELADDNAPNWVGTIRVYTGAVLEGEHNPGDGFTGFDGSLVRDVRAVRPGSNLWEPNWDGGTLFHVSGINVQAEYTEFVVDTRARDTMKVWEVIRRNRESRKSPDRQWLAQNRRSGLRDDSGAFYDVGIFGKIPRTFLPADEWTVIATPAGRSGVIQTLDLQTDSDPAAFGLAIFGKQVDKSWCNRKLGDPFATGWTKRVRINTKTWRTNRWMVNVWGQDSQPCGYWPGQHTADDDGDGVGVTDETITGQYRDEQGFTYFCKGSPVLWIAVRPDRDCFLQGGRVLEILLDDAAG